MTAQILRRLVGAILCATPLLARAQSIPAPVTALRFGAMADPSGRTTKNVTILVQADTVLRVGTGTAMIPKGATVVDLRRYTAIPGLVDVHTHMTFVRDKSNPLVNGPRSRDSVIAAAATNLRRTLETGVTTVRDLGASNYADMRTELVIVDAVEMQELARVFLPFRMTPQVHARWYNNTELPFSVEVIAPYRGRVQES